MSDTGKTDVHHKDEIRVLMVFRKFITYKHTVFVQMTVTAAGYETKPHINTTGDDTSQFSETFRPSESQEIERRFGDPINTTNATKKRGKKIDTLKKFELHFRRTYIPKVEWI